MFMWNEMIYLGMIYLDIYICTHMRFESLLNLEGAKYSASQLMQARASKYPLLMELYAPFHIICCATNCMEWKPWYIVNMWLFRFFEVLWFLKASHTISLVTIVDSRKQLLIVLNFYLIVTWKVLGNGHIIAQQIDYNTRILTLVLPKLTMHHKHLNN